MTTTKQIKPYPFIENPNPDNIDKNITNTYIINKLKNFKRYDFGIDNLTQYGYYKLLGYIYPCASFLKRYVYKQHNSWHESYALNKTNLKQLQGYNITNIMEIK